MKEKPSKQDKQSSLQIGDLFVKLIKSYTKTDQFAPKRKLHNPHGNLPAAAGLDDPLPDQKEVDYVRNNFKEVNQLLFESKEGVTAFLKHIHSYSLPSVSELFKDKTRLQYISQFTRNSKATLPNAFLLAQSRSRNHFSEIDETVDLVNSYISHPELVAAIFVYCDMTSGYLKKVKEEVIKKLSKRQNTDFDEFIKLWEDPGNFLKEYMQACALLIKEGQESITFSELTALLVKLNVFLNKGVRNPHSEGNYLLQCPAAGVITRQNYFQDRVLDEILRRFQEEKPFTELKSNISTFVKTHHEKHLEDERRRKRLKKYGYELSLDEDITQKQLVEKLRENMGDVSWSLDIWRKYTIRKKRKCFVLPTTELPNVRGYINPSVELPKRAIVLEVPTGQHISRQEGLALEKAIKARRDVYFYFNGELQKVSYFGAKEFLEKIVAAFVAKGVIQC